MPASYKCYVWYRIQVPDAQSTRFAANSPNTLCTYLILVPSRSSCRINKKCRSTLPYPSISATFSAVTGSITPRSQMIALISSAGVTSNAGL